MWDTFADHLWGLGRGRKNLWLEGLWEHLLNSMNWCPMAFERGCICYTGKMVLNERVGHDVNDLLLLLVEA